MDLLFLPTDESAPDLAPYVCADRRWDGGYFMHYACRNGWLDRVPLRLRKCSCPAPYLEPFRPTAPEESQVFYQNWFFFGLLAELYGLNDEPEDDETHTRAPAHTPERTERLDWIYDNFTRSGSEGAHILGAKLLDEQERTRVMYLMTRDAKRFDYPKECLQFACFMMGMNPNKSEFEPSILMSIAALGELVCSVMDIFVRRGLFNSSGQTFVLGSWVYRYPEPRSDAEAKMLDNGWCTSDLERIRNVYHGFNTRYFLSRLQKPIAGADHHASCSSTRCTAAQIVMELYKLSHAGENCACTEVGVDTGATEYILSGTKSFPVLRLRFAEGDSESVTITVEEYSPGKPYVALSHAWVDGLGNPEANSLQSCQLPRLARLIEGLHSSLGGDSTPSTRPPVRLWIDTLCCPISLKEKTIALQRIATVYREASHVLVLDKSIESFPSKGRHPAEACLRMLASSTWMGRLWTLQEGALAKSLYFQFRDGPVNLVDHAAKLHSEALRDAKYWRIWTDISVELNRLCEFESGESGLGETRAEKWSHLQVFERLQRLRCALHFRNVTVPSDEPLCIATLLSLDPEVVSKTTCRQERMGRVWKLVAQACGGFPAKVIFYVEHPLQLSTLSGWRWAPRSRLGLDSCINYDAATGIFQSSSARGSSQLGTVSGYGLRVTYPGHTIALRPWVEGSSHKSPWNWFFRRQRAPEIRLLCRHESSKKWFYMSDYFRNQMQLSLSWDKQNESDKELADKDAKQPLEGKRPSQPLFNHLVSGNMALIQDTPEQPRTTINLLVRLRSEHVEKAPLRVHACRPVMLTEVESDFVLVMETVRHLAISVASHESNRELLRVLEEEGEQSEESDKYKQAVETVKQEMKRLAWEAWDGNSEFARAFVDHTGASRETCWAAIPALLPFDLVLGTLPEDQVWEVDRPAGGDGRCAEKCCGHEESGRQR